MDNHENNIHFIVKQVIVNCHFVIISEFNVRFSTKNEILYFLPLSIDKTEVYNMCIAHFNIIRIVRAYTFHVPPVNYKFLKCPFHSFFVRKSELQELFAQNTGLREDFDHFFLSIKKKSYPKTV